MKTTIASLTPAELANLRKESRRTGYSVKQLLEIRAEHAVEEKLDRASYAEMTAEERAAHDNE